MFETFEEYLAALHGAFMAESESGFKLFKLPACKTCGEVSVNRGYCTICGRIPNAKNEVSVVVVMDDGLTRIVGTCLCNFPRQFEHKSGDTYYLHRITLEFEYVEWTYFIYTKIRSYGGSKDWMKLPLFDTHVERFYRRNSA